MHFESDVMTGHRVAAIAVISVLQLSMFALAYNCFFGNCSQQLFQHVLFPAIVLTAQSYSCQCLRNLHV